MTTHVNHPTSSGPETAERGEEQAGRVGASGRPRWLLPTLLVGAGAIGLVVLGVIPLPTALYVAAFGAMALMHLVGHGHGGHGAGRHGSPHGSREASSDAYAERRPMPEEGAAGAAEHRGVGRPTDGDVGGGRHGCH